MHPLVEKLSNNHYLSKDEWIRLINDKKNIDLKALQSLAVTQRKQHYDNKIFLRGLIEFSNYCKNDCLYCGIRKSNLNVQRYRLTEDEILECCRLGNTLGYKTFVLQSGEDPFFTVERINSIIRKIKKEFPDSALTLSLGEHSKEAYKQWFDSGADRYLLRHETANSNHYAKLHPKEMRLQTRMQSLKDLRSIGYQVGVGFMVGSPYQTTETLADDMVFIQNFKPHMVGIGPFISQKDTPFRDQPSGTLEDTLFFLSLIRLISPKVLLPATTALGTINPLGREMGIESGANVLMPNLSPQNVRDKYLLYDNKICTGDEAAECYSCLSKRMERINYQIESSRGDSLIDKS